MLKNLFIALLTFSCCFSSALAADNPTPAPTQLPNNPKITDEQRAKLRETNEKFRNQQNALYEKLRTARREVEQAAQADPLDENAIRTKAATLGQIEGELAILRAKHYKELRTVLPHDQAQSQQSDPAAGPGIQSTQRLQNALRRETNVPVKPRPAPRQ